MKRPFAPGPGASFAISLGVALLLSFVLTHVLFAFSLPPPFQDESWFAIPAVNLALNGSLSADHTQIDNIYWLPPALYVLNGIAFFVTRTISLHVARTISFLCAAVAALLFYRLTSRLLGKPGPFAKIATLAWILCSPIVYAADLARPEALALLLSFAALLCLFHGAWTGAAALTLLCLLTHPLLAAPLLLTFTAALPAARLSRPAVWEAVPAVPALSLLAWEMTRLALDPHTYVVHWRYQLAIKFHQVPHGPVSLSAYVATAGLFVWSASRSVRPGNRTGLPHGPSLPLFGCACILVWLFSRQYFYLPFTVTGALILLGAVLVAACGRWPAASSMLTGSACAITLLAALASWSTALFSPTGTLFLYYQTTSPLAPAARQLLLDGRPHRVLVAPRMYYAFMTDRDPHALDVWTWYPFVPSFTVPFDRALVLQKDTSPEGLNLRTQLPGHVCLARKLIPLGDGATFANLMELGPSPDGPRTPFVPCPQP